MERDCFMSAEEALNFGLIDKILEKRSDADPEAGDKKD